MCTARGHPIPIESSTRRLEPTLAQTLAPHGAKAVAPTSMIASEYTARC